MDFWNIPCRTLLAYFGLHGMKEGFSCVKYPPKPLFLQVTQLAIPASSVKFEFVEGNRDSDFL
jgi:hypothetical protein